MRYIDLIVERPLIWGLFLLYLIGTSALAWMGHKKTTDIESFSIGSGEMNPWVVGITLAASIASAATFVINPGFVYVHGVAALMHFGVAAGLGIAVGLIAMSTGFRKVGARYKAITMPQWVGERYGSRAMAVYFAAMNLLSITFMVLIVGGLSLVMQRTIGLTNVESLVLIIGFVFSYIFVGGTWAHAYTNTLQGAIMIVVSVIIVGSGAHYLSEGIFDKMAAVGPELVGLVNPKSNLYSSFFSVYVSGFLIGFALMCQPHIMTKALYVKSDQDVYRYLAVTIAVSLLFTSLLVVGLYAHAMGISPEALRDPATGQIKQDLVMTVYLGKTFSAPMLAVIAVALMAAGMSTLDGILVALSSIAANDLFLNLTRDNLLKDKTPKERSLAAHRASQVILVVMGLVTFLICLDPPKLLGIFGQLGVYGFVAASVTPILFGILVPTGHRDVAFAAGIAGPAIHFLLYAWVSGAQEAKEDLVQTVQGWGPLGWIFDTSAPQLGLLNPSVTATYGILASALIALPFVIRYYATRRDQPQAN
jgi:sodium/pantothenate symporter